MDCHKLALLGLTRLVVGEKSVGQFWTEHLIYPSYELLSGRRILSRLIRLDASQWWPSDEITNWQQARLAELLRHAYDTVPYYHRVFDAARISPADVRAVNDLCQLPLLTKSIIQEHREEMVSAVYPPDRRIANHTGGSTGTPMHFYQDRRQRDWGSANKLRCNRWAGWDFGKRTLRLWGHPQDLRAAQSAGGKLRGLLLKEYTFDAFGFSTDDMADLVEYIRDKRPEIIVAYASMLSHFAAYVEEQHIGDFPIPDGVITSTDMLFPHQRALIERVFRAEVFNRYGCREVSVIAAECDEHRGLHINADRLIVELVDQGGKPVSPGEPGRVVITDLFNYAMPFIRYSIDDVAIPGLEECPCGRRLPLMKELVGRYADILTTPEGQFVSASALTTILSQIPGLRECQLVQKAVDWVQVNAVCYPDYGESSEMVFRKHLVKFFGPNMHITFNYVDDIPRTASGKKRFSVSEVETRFL
jgi:phenylacetate-CoA ligase